MNKNIDLGTFTWDISALEKQILDNKAAMDNYAASLKKAKEELKNSNKEIQENVLVLKLGATAQTELNKAYKSGAITLDQYNTETNAINIGMAESKKQINELAKSQLAQQKIINDSEQATKSLRLENNELNKLMSVGRTEAQSNKSAYRDLEKELNALKIESKNLGAEMLKLERSGKGSSKEYQDLKIEFEETSKKANALNDDFKKLDKSVGDNFRTVGDYKDQIVGAWGEIGDKVKAGDLRGAFDSAKDGLKGIFDLVKANPLLLLLTGIALFVKEVLEYNSQVKELNLQVENLANTSGKATDELRKNALAIQETYGRDFKESVAELNSLITDFGVTSDEAFRIYNEGLAAGGATNSEFGDSIREYGPLFSQAGYSAQDFVNILNAGIDLGVYNDKLPDAIKEASIALKEQTKSTRDALVNAFGASFTDDLLKRIQSGKTTIADALKEISDKAEDAQLNQQQLAQLTADVFKGAGEDAGGALVIFEAINKSQRINYDNLTDLQKATYDVAIANKELSDAKDDAFKSDAIISFQQTFDKVWREIKIAFFKTIGDIVKNTQKEIDFLKLYFYNLKDALISIPVSFALVMRGLYGDFKQLASVASAVGNVFKNIFNPDALDIAVRDLYRKVTDFKSLAVAAVGDVAKLNSNLNKNNSNKIASERERSNKKARDINGLTTGPVAEAEAKAAKERAAAEAKAKAEAEKLAKQNKSSSDKAVRDAEKAANDKTKALEAAAKKALEIAKYEADQAVAIAKNELAEYISINASKLTNDKRLTTEKLANQIKYYDDLKALQVKNNTADLEKALVGKTEEEKIQIRKEYAIKEVEINNDINEKKKEINTAFETQTLEDKKIADAIDFQQRLINLEEQGVSEYELRTSQLAGQKEADLEQLEADKENELISLANYEAQKKLIESQYANESKLITKDVDEYKIESRSQVYNGLANLFGRESALGKTFALAEIVNDTVTNASKAFTQAAVFASNPLTAPLAPNAYIQGGIIIATGAAQAAKLIAPKPKAARGMMIEGNSHADGGVPVNTPNGLIEAEGGEIIMNKNSSRMFRNQLSAISEAGGGVKFARGGVISSSMPGVQKSLSGGLDYSLVAEMLKDAVMEGSAIGTQSGSKKGIADLSEKTKIIEKANF